MILPRALIDASWGKRVIVSGQLTRRIFHQNRGSERRFSDKLDKEGSCTRGMRGDGMPNLKQEGAWRIIYRVGGRRPTNLLDIY